MAFPLEIGDPHVECRTSIARDARPLRWIAEPKEDARDVGFGAGSPRGIERFEAI
jgi:hypothetical protein